MSLEWPVAPPAGSDQSSVSPSHEDPYGGHPEDALPTHPHLRWRRDALLPPQIQRGSLDRHSCVHVPDGGLRCVTWSTRGLIGFPTSTQLSREQKHHYFSRLIENNNIVCLQEVHGKDEILLCEPEELRFNVWNQTFTDGDMVIVALFHSLFPRVLEIAEPDYTRRDSSVSGVICTLSRIHKAFIHIPTAEARDFHCSSHVFENLVKRSIPSDHAAVRVVIQKPTMRGHQGKRIPSLMSKHPVFCYILRRLDDDHQYLADPFGTLAHFKTILQKARRQTVRERAKLLTASTDTSAH